MERSEVAARQTRWRARCRDFAVAADLSRFTLTSSLDFEYSSRTILSDCDSPKITATPSRVGSMDQAPTVVSLLAWSAEPLGSHGHVASLCPALAVGDRGQSGQVRLILRALRTESRWTWFVAGTFLASPQEGNTAASRTAHRTCGVRGIFRPRCEAFHFPSKIMLSNNTVL